MINTKLIYKNKKLNLSKEKKINKKSEILIEVKSCGICGSDLKILDFGSSRVKSGTVLGHEISGKIIINNKIG